MENLPSEPSLNGARISNQCVASLTLLGATALAYVLLLLDDTTGLRTASLPPLWRALILASPITGLYGRRVGAVELRRPWRSDLAGGIALSAGALVLALGLLMWAAAAFSLLFG